MVLFHKYKNYLPKNKKPQPDGCGVGLYCNSEFCPNCVTAAGYSLSVAGASLGVISIWYHLYSGFIIAPVAASIPQPSTSQRLMIDTGLNFLSITMVSV